MPPRHAAYKGEVSRVVLSTLRDAKANNRLVNTVTKRVGTSLRHHRAKGLIRSAKGLGDRIAWEVAR